MLNLYTLLNEADHWPFAFLFLYQFSSYPGFIFGPTGLSATLIVNSSLVGINLEKDMVKLQSSVDRWAGLIEMSSLSLPVFKERS